ncbi:MAG: LytTR family transcriptional regulator [Saprospiraceae bacterium]|nr:LytTR family transcriptional regulator [Saprospiraceae bacterium]
MTSNATSQNHLFTSNSDVLYPTRNNMRQNGHKTSHFAIGIGSSYLICDISEIILCRAEGNYTTIYLTNDRKFVSCKNLKVVEDLLANKTFLRIHHSYLVNFAFIERMFLGEEDYILLRDGRKLPMSRRRKKVILERVTLL